MENKSNILGCFVFGASVLFDDDQKTKEFASKQTEIFSNYIWGENGICKTLKKLNRESYGNDMSLILFQFYVNPIPYVLQNLKEIEAYRKKEKSVAIPIIVNAENFFNQSVEGRYNFLKQTIFQKLDVLAGVVNKKKLDTKIELLKADLEKIF